MCMTRAQIEQGGFHRSRASSASFGQEIDAQWAAFFDAWGVVYRYQQGILNDDMASDIPSFFIPDGKVWIETYERREMVHFEALLESRIDFVERSGHAFLCLFGPPALRIPEYQGWGLRIRDGRRVAFPFHLIACPGCGGFCATGFGTAASREHDPLGYHRLLRGATRLQHAYDAASRVRLFLH